MISLEERECAILRASAERERARVTGGWGLESLTLSVTSVEGDDCRFWSMPWRACCSSRRSPTRRPRSSSSEESGGVVIAPGGIRRSFTGGGDGRRLPFVDGPCWVASDLVSVVVLGDSPFATVFSIVTDVDDRRDFARYEVDETERGSDGRRVVTGEWGG